MAPGVLCVWRFPFRLAAMVARAARLVRPNCGTVGPPMAAKTAPQTVPAPAPADEVRRAFGVAVAVARKRRKYSQREFASVAGVDRGRPSRIEAGRGAATIGLQYRLARAAGPPPAPPW